MLGKSAVARDLIEAGANALARVLIEEGAKAVATVLIEAGANKEARDENQRTPLHLAAELGKPAVARP
jgi:ankyrin repeat protein